MKVHVKGFLTFKDLIGGKGELSLDLEAATVRDLLTELSARFGRELQAECFEVSRDGKQPHNQVLINGRSLRHFASGLEEALRDGDVVALFPPAAGG